MNNNINNNHNVLQIINDNNNNITPPIVDVKIINIRQKFRTKKTAAARIYLISKKKVYLKMLQ